MSLRRLLQRDEAGMLLLYSCAIAKMGVNYIMYSISYNFQKLHTSCPTSVRNRFVIITICKVCLSSTDYASGEGGVGMICRCCHNSYLANANRLAYIFLTELLISIFLF